LPLARILHVRGMHRYRDTSRCIPTSVPIGVVYYRYWGGAPRTPMWIIHMAMYTSVECRGRRHIHRQRRLHFFRRHHRPGRLLSFSRRRHHHSVRLTLYLMKVPHSDQPGPPRDQHARPQVPDRAHMRCIIKPASGLTGRKIFFSSSGFGPAWSPRANGMQVGRVQGSTCLTSRGPPQISPLRPELYDGIWVWTREARCASRGPCSLYRNHIACDFDWSRVAGRVERVGSREARWTSHCHPARVSLLLFV
jgi:hypothetical protein